jgi:hypothetical protein
MYDSPTCFGIRLPSSGSVPSVFWEMLNWGAVDNIVDGPVVSSDVVRGDLSFEIIDMINKLN